MTDHRRWTEHVVAEPRKETTLADLEEHFPNWTITHLGRWWANDTRQQPLREGWLVTVGADSAEELWDKLLVQEQLRRSR